MSWALKAEEVPSVDNWRRAFQTEGTAGKSWRLKQCGRGAVWAELPVAGTEDKVPVAGSRQSCGASGASSAQMLRCAVRPGA